MRIGATIFNQNYTDWDRYEAEEQRKSVPKRAKRSDREIFRDELGIALVGIGRNGVEDRSVNPAGTDAIDPDLVLQKELLQTLAPPGGLCASAESPEPSQES
jgi:hypothetical protein